MPLKSAKKKSRKSGGKKMVCYTVPPEQIEALLAEHIEEVRPAIAKLDRQQVRVVSEERDG